MNDETAAAIEAPAPEEITETDNLAAIYDKLTEAVPEETPEPVAAVEPVSDEPAPEAPEQPAQAQVEAPSDVPAALKAKWPTLAPDVQDAVLSTHRDLSRKLAEQGRVSQGVKPVVDVLQQAIKDIPTMRDMRPEEVARDVFQMAQRMHELNVNPVQTLLRVAQERGAIDGLRQALEGTAPNASAQENVALSREVATLKKQLQQATAPEAMDLRIEHRLTTRDVERSVTSYAAGKKDWANVEPFIPNMIPIAQSRLGPGASATDVLEAAYDMAIHAIPDLRARATAAAQAPVATDPAKTEAQARAKSVNVTSRPSAPKEMTERQAYEAVWAKHKG